LHKGKLRVIRRNSDVANAAWELARYKQALSAKKVRNNTLKKFGPVREVSKTFVVEIAFDSINISKRHKSGIALRFPRVKSLRQDKPASEVIQLLQFKSEFI
jgi:ATP-dependent DNA ligase